MNCLPLTAPKIFRVQKINFNSLDFLIFGFQESSGQHLQNIDRQVFPNHSILPHRSYGLSVAIFCAPTIVSLNFLGSLSWMPILIYCIQIPQRL